VTSIVTISIFLKNLITTKNIESLYQGLEPFEFIGIGSGTGSPKVKELFWLFDKKKIKVSVPNDFSTDSR